MSAAATSAGSLISNAGSSYRKATLTRKWQSSLSLSSSFSLVASAHGLQICCCSSPKPRGFSFEPQTKTPRKDRRGGKNAETPLAGSSTSTQPRKRSSGSLTTPNQAPGLRSQMDGKSNNSSVDQEFEERLQALKRLALQQKKAGEEKNYGAIDYDAPAETKNGTVGMAAKIGAGFAVAIFGLIFAFGDFLPFGSVSPTEEATTLDTRISSEEKENLKMRLRLFEETLRANPEDAAALEGAGVTLAELGEYNRAASLLEDLAKKKPSDPAVFRLLGEVKYQVKDYEGSAGAYKTSAMVSKSLDIEVLRGLTNALLAAKRPGEAVEVLLTSRARLEKESNTVSRVEAKSNQLEENYPVDPIQLDLLLGKAYSDWGHVSDAVAAYDAIISEHPDDFRGYLAKGIILKENGNIGDAERMFIQAKFFAPQKAKSLVDKYSR